MLTYLKTLSLFIIAEFKTLSITIIGKNSKQKTVWPGVFCLTGGCSLCYTVIRSRRSSLINLCLGDGMGKLPAVPRDVMVRIEDVDEVQDSMRIYVGDTGYPIGLTEFKDLISEEVGKSIDFKHLVRNIAIRAALSKVDPTDLIAIKTLVESTSFKV